MPRISKSSLSAQFTKHRRPNSRRYHDSAKQLAREAKLSGASIAEIAAAAGLSRNTIQAWLATSNTPPLQELKLADISSKQPQRLVIHLPSGITIEVTAC